METSKMEDLEEVFLRAKERGNLYVAVLIEMVGFPKPELIVNSYDNIDSKLEYYKKTYDENLNHKFAKGIKIISADCGDDLESFEFLLY